MKKKHRRTHTHTILKTKTKIESDQKTSRVPTDFPSIWNNWLNKFQTKHPVKKTLVLIYFLLHIPKSPPSSVLTGIVDKEEDEKNLVRIFVKTTLYIILLIKSTPLRIYFSTNLFGVLLHLSNNKSLLNFR